MNMIEYKNHQIEIVIDEYPSNPYEEFDHLGIIVSNHRRYTIGEKHYHNPPKNALVFPIYIYDHGNIDLSMTPFSCPFDSGQIGYIYATKEKILKEYNRKIFTKKLKNTVYNLFNHQITEYNAYLNGDVYAYTIMHNDEIIDSCCGFYGESGRDFAIQTAKETIDYIIREEQKQCGIQTELAFS